MSIDAKLNEEIERELDAIYEMEVGSEKHSHSVDNLTKVLDRVIKMQSLDADERNKAAEREAAEKARIEEMRARDAEREAEGKRKDAEQESEKIDRLIGHGITVGLGLLGMGLTLYGFNKSMKYEEIGTITTQAGKFMLNKILGRK
jgi:septal ring factor EnvC (AmiA/AmiB activator)